MSELKPCPFCGERDNWLIGDEIKGHHVIACDNCGAKGPYDSKEWNTRASEWVSVDSVDPRYRLLYHLGNEFLATLLRDGEMTIHAQSSFAEKWTGALFDIDGGCPGDHLPSPPNRRLIMTEITAERRQVLDTLLEKLDEMYDLGVKHGEAHIKPQLAEPQSWCNFELQEAGVPVIIVGNKKKDAVLFNPNNLGSQILLPDLSRRGHWVIDPDNPLKGKPEGLRDNAKIAIWRRENGLNQVMPDVRLAGLIEDWSQVFAFTILETHNTGAMT